MTPWHYRWLCQLSYIDLPEGAGLRAGRTLGALSRELLALDGKNALTCGKLSRDDREALHIISQDAQLSVLHLLEFINRNADTGLVAYILKAEDGGLHCIFRGSESRGCGVPTSIDWLDNFLSPFIGSVQYREIRNLTARLSADQTVFSGHSKGAHNALYALAVSSGASDRAVTFNGQGFAPGQLNARQIDRLKKNGINYVTRGDIVGVLLWHPEKRIFVRKEDGQHAHALSAFRFDEEGEPIPSLRPIWSLAVEWGVMRYWRSLKLRLG